MAYITAWNPESQQLSSDENAVAQIKLIQAIRERGSAFYEGDGIPDQKDWPAERSLWVGGITRLEAAKIGSQFGQNAIIVGEYGEPRSFSIVVALMRETWPVK